jgi:hypothetical protein
VPDAHPAQSSQTTGDSRTGCFAAWSRKKTPQVGE